MSFMELQITKKGRLAACDCGRCGITRYWHEWVHDGQAQDLKDGRCSECGGKLDQETYWESRSRNWYAGRYSAPVYMGCTDWLYETNKRRLERDLKAIYGGSDE